MCLSICLSASFPQMRRSSEWGQQKGGVAKIGMRWIRSLPGRNSAFGTLLQEAACGTERGSGWMRRTAGESAATPALQGRALGDLRRGTGGTPYIFAFYLLLAAEMLPSMLREILFRTSAKNHRGEQYRG